MPTVRFRLPGRAEVLGARLSRLLPSIDRSLRQRWVEDARLRVDGRVVDRVGMRCRAGARIEIDDVPEEALTPRVERASPDWVVWADAPVAAAGRVELGGGASLALEVLERRGGLAMLWLHGAPCTAEAVCEALARGGLPVAGDLRRGGLGVEGGPRIEAWVATRGAEAATSGAGTAAPEADAAACEARRPAPDRLAAGWPDEPAWPAPEAPDAPLRLRVSDETLRALARGHPWLRPDGASESPDAFAPGTRVRVEGRAGQRAGWALIEGDPRLAARIWATGDVEARAIASVEARIARALARRRAWLLPGPEPVTGAIRLVHGEGDALPGLVVDRLGPLLRVLVTGRASDGFRDRALRALLEQLPLTPEGQAWSVLELLHLRERPPVRLEAVRWRAGGVEALRAAGAEVAGEALRVEERGLHFWVDPGWAPGQRVRPGFGLFLDQRENRARVAERARRGGRWLNLFAHTGAFSVALLAAGAASVVSVDLSAGYLDRLVRNLEANRERGVAPERHVAVRGDGRRYLETLGEGECFDGIVVDPPTAAAAGRRFWSLRRDLEQLLRHCIARLAAGGTLLVTQNRRGPPLGLDRVLERICAREHRAVDRLEPAPPGEDHPSLPGFPEGDAFEGWLLTLGE